VAVRQIVVGSAAKCPRRVGDDPLMNRRKINEQRRAVAEGWLTPKGEVLRELLFLI
jgi:hypothetical protein